MTYAVTDLYIRYGPMILRRCERMLGDKSEAEDAMQEVFLQIIRHKSELNLENPSSLLWKIATNLCLNRLRKSKRNILIEKGEIFDEILRDEGFEDHMMARSWIQKFFPKTEQGKGLLLVAWLHYVDGMTLEQVAEMTDLSVSGVRKRLSTLKAKAIAQGE